MSINSGYSFTELPIAEIVGQTLMRAREKGKSMFHCLKDMGWKNRSQITLQCSFLAVILYMLTELQGQCYVLTVFLY